MATIKAARAISSSAALRQKPFTPIARPASSRAAVRVRAAEVEAAAEDLDFQFSFSDAKKNNEYSANDVEAALRFYIDGEGSAPIHDADFVTNTLGMEDASFFDDIDNNEGYEEDEYLVAGIPEAAPKKRRDGRRGQGAADEGDDDLEQAKALDKVKALEDRMVLEAALEEEYGDASTVSTRADTKAKGVWDWLLDGAEAEGFDDTQAVLSASRPSVSLVSDNEVASDMARVNPEVFEQPEVRDYLELFANDDLSEEVLAAANSTDDGNYPASTITDADVSRLDAVIKAAVPDLAVKELAANTVPLLGEDGDLDAATVDSYIEALRSAFKGGNSEDEVKALFGAEPLTEEVIEAVDTSKEYQQILAFKAEDVPAVELDLSAVDEVVAAAEEDEDDEGFEAELRSLAAVEVFRPEDLPSAEELDLADQYLATAEDYIAQDEARKAQIAAAVARGELSPDSLAEELEVVADAEAELLAMEDDGDLDDVAADDEDDGEAWVERIIEMTRVTKVVKGGKIMGFRCVAIVGNQKGLVGVGCAAGREIAVAVKRTLVDAKKNLVYVPLVGEDTIPHRAESKFHAGRVVLVPASGGTGCIAGGVVRSVLELAGVKNCLSKRLGSRSPLNTARATVKALGSVQTLEGVSASRGVPMSQLLQLA